MSLFFPDGEWLVFFDVADQALKRVSVHGGAAMSLTRARGDLDFDLGPDDAIVYQTGGLDTGLFRISLAGGEPEVLTTPGEGEIVHIDPRSCPTARRSCSRW